MGGAYRSLLARRLVRHWPALESLSIRGHRLVQLEPPSGAPAEEALFGNNTKLSEFHLEVHERGPGQSVGMVDLLVDLPSTVTTLTVDIVDGRPDVARAVDTHLQPVAKQFEKVFVLSSQSSGLVNLDLDELVSRMTAVRKLTLTTQAISQPSVALAPLKQLVELGFVQTPKDGVKHHGGQQYVRLLQILRSGAKLALPARLWRSWSADERTAVEKAARARDVALARTFTQASLSLSYESLHAFRLVHHSRVSAWLLLPPPRRTAVQPNPSHVQVVRQ